MHTRMIHSLSIQRMYFRIGVGLFLVVSSDFILWKKWAVRSIKGFINASLATTLCWHPLLVFFLFSFFFACVREYMCTYMFFFLFFFSPFCFFLSCSSLRKHIVKWESVKSMNLRDSFSSLFFRIPLYFFMILICVPMKRSYGRNFIFSFLFFF